jgi:hypothetical protein
MLTRNPRNIAQAFKFHNLNPPTVSSYLKNCLKNITYITVVTKIATWFKCTVKASDSHNIYFLLKYVSFFNSNVTYFPKINLFGLQIAALKLIHPPEFCMHFLAHWYKLNYSSSMLSEFHYLQQQYVMHTNHTHFITSLILDPITFFRTLFSWTSRFRCITQFTNHVCVGTTQNKNTNDARKEVKRLERKCGGERGPITNMGITSF